MKHYSHWDEFQWENEIRRHENNVADFFHDLVYCLDLPIGEMPAELPETAETPSDPVTASRNAALRQWMSDHEAEENDEQEQDYEPRHPVCFSCVDALDDLSAKWNQFCVQNYHNENFLPALGISCAFAKLLARTADFTEPGKFNTPALLTSLGKRAIADLEDLVAGLTNFQSEFFPESYAGVSYFISRLALIRDQLVEKLAEVRNSAE